MEIDEKTLRKQLENKSYRFLQQTTKALGLPANFKKIHLINLIIARKLERQTEEQEIISKAKQERLNSSHIRRQSKRRINMPEDKKHRVFYSPPIMATPRHSQITFSRRCSLLKRLTNSPNNTNRILRSCMSRNIVDVIKARRTEDCMKIVGRQNLSLAKCIVKLQPDLSVSLIERNENVDMDVENIQPAKRQRKISGIYPLKPNDIQINGVSLRRKDGTISKINAIVQRRTYEQKTNTDYIQDVLNNFDENMILEDSNNNLCPSVTDSGFCERNTGVESNESNCYKKIEELKYRRYEKGLPRIADVFSKFNARPDYSQPLHVNVSGEGERFPQNTTFSTMTNTSTLMLEKMYNFKNNFLINTPWSQTLSKAITKSVHCTNTVVTTKVYPTTAVIHNPYSYDPESYYRNQILNQRFGDFLRCSEPGLHTDSICSEDMNNSTSSDTCRNVGASVTIPEMVEDAFEIISQDGDYMERLGMDVKAQCVLCEWTGPTIIMEYHIQKEHPHHILKQNKSEWNITYTLASLVTDPLWFSKIIEYNSVFYILSAKYEDPNCFMATLSSLSSDSLPQTGSITIYNKVSGEPYTWQGDIEHLPPNLPYQNNLNGLKLNLATLDLIPNSANLKLVNRELVSDSPNKVVVGQPELRDIHIILFVRVIN